jgi:hypothetical protein
MKNLIFFIMLALLFVGCAKQPEKTDLEETVTEIISELEEERAAKCGDGIKDEWEECDVEGLVPCSFFDKTLVGNMECVNCIFDKYYCENNEQCNDKFCKGNGICRENEQLDYEIFCECFEGYTGENCEECDESFHLDFDQRCISDQTCTLIGCELEKEECYINKGMAKCSCKYPYIGDNCEKCAYGYYYDDGICKESSCICVECAE